MPKIQRAVTRDYTVVHNEFVRDTKLGIAERGLLLTMLSKSNTYEFSIQGLAYELPDGKTRIANCLRKLEELGYLRRTRTVEKGKYTDMIYEISDEPIFRETEDSSSEEESGNSGENSNEDSKEDSPKVESPILEDSVMEKPELENPVVDSPVLQKPLDLVNTNQPNTKKPSTKKTSTSTRTHGGAVSINSGADKGAKLQKIHYAEAVTMTEKQYQTLLSEHTQAFVDKCIEHLNNYKMSNGKTYKSDYHAILHWVIKSVAETNPMLDRADLPQPSELLEGENPYDKYL